MPDYAHLLPEPIRRFTLPQEIHDTEHLSFIQGGGHGESQGYDGCEATRYGFGFHAAPLFRRRRRFVYSRTYAKSTCRTAAVARIASPQRIGYGSTP